MKVSRYVGLTAAAAAFLLLAAACQSDPTATPTSRPQATATPTATRAPAAPTATPTTAPAAPTATPTRAPAAPTPTTPPAAGGDAARGQQVATQNGCLGCHSIDGSRVVGPTWKGLAGKEETLTGGTKVTVDDAYLKESIVNPAAKIVDTYPPAMPPFASLTEQQILDIIAYIKTLK